MREAVSNLSRLSVALRSGRPVPETVARWLAEGAERYLRGETKDLEAALGLKAPGCNSAARIKAKERRNAALLAAADCCGRLNARNDPWSLARRLAVAVERYGRRKRAAWAALEAPPATATGLEAHLWRAYRAADAAGLRVPTTAEGLYRVLRL